MAKNLTTHDKFSHLGKSFGVFDVSLDMNYRSQMTPKTGIRNLNIYKHENVGENHPKMSLVYEHPLKHHNKK